MSGLNDDFILADDSMEPKDAPAVVINAFKDSVDEEGVPELRDDVDLIAVATEDLIVQLRDLDIIEQGIKAQGGMNQTAALEVHALIPAFLNEDRTVQYFTKHPSKTLLVVALEEIGEEKKGIVRRMIDALINFFNKLVTKIKSFFSSSKMDKKTTQDNEQFAKNYKGPARKEEQDNKTEWAKDVATKLSNFDRGMILSMETSEFLRAYHRIISGLESVLKKNFDKHEALNNSLKNDVEACDKVYAGITTKADSWETFNEVAKLIEDNTATRQLLQNYEGTAELVDRLRSFIEKTTTELVKLKKETTDDSRETVNILQQIASQTGAVLRLFMDISGARSSLISELRNAWMHKD